MISALNASWGSLGTFLSHLLGLLVALGASLGASWDSLGLLGRLLVSLGASLGRCWDRLAGCWVSLGGRWRLFGSFLARFAAYTVPQTSRLQDLLLLNAQNGCLLVGLGVMRFLASAVGFVRFGWR